MPGIFGFYNKTQSASIRTMQATMMLYPHFKQDTLFEDDVISASRIHLNKVGERDSPHQNNGVFVWVEGEAYNLSELSDEFDYQELPFSAALSISYKNNKLESFLNKIDGYFCAVIYDQKLKKIKLISDRYGMRMLYWYHNGNQFAWSSEVKGILALDNINKTIDATSFNCFLELGYLLDEHTWFDKIKLIKPATILSFDLQTESIQQSYYWTWSEIQPLSLTFEEAVDELGRRFINAVKKRFDPNENIGISLSGGLDSRAILAAVQHLYPEYTGYTYTFGLPGCDDINIATKVVKLTNWQHQAYHFNNVNWFEPRIEKIWNTDGMQDMMHMHGAEFLSDISKKMDINLNGYAGDAIFGGSFLNSIPLNTRASKFNLVSFYKDHINLANTDNELYNIEKAEPNLYMNRVRRFTAMGTVNSLVSIEQRKPFFDNSCVELIYSIPDEYRLNNKLYSAMLQKFFPIFFKEIPWQKTGKPAGIISQKSIPIRAISKIIRLTKTLFGVHSNMNYTDYSTWIRSPEIACILKDLLNGDNTEYKKLTDIDFFETYLLPHLNNKMLNNSNEILRIATIELYLRRVNKTDVLNF